MTSTTRRMRGARRGSVLAGTAIVSSIMCLMVAGYLGYLSHEYYTNYRSFNWTQALHLVEAGLDEGLFELNFRHLKGVGFWSLNGWHPIDEDHPPLIPLGGGDTGYTKTVSNFRNTDNTIIGKFTIQIINPGSDDPYALAKGTVTNCPYGQKVSRLAKISIYRRPLFAFGFFADGYIDLKGNNVSTDSYISSDPNYSTNNRWDLNKHRDNGNIATNLAVTDSIGIGNANIWGYASTGPGGSVTIGPNGNIGPFGTRNGQIAEGYVRDDTEVDLPQITLPVDFNIWAADQAGTITNSATIDSGDTVINAVNLSGNQTLTFDGSDIRVYVKGNIDITGQGKMISTPGSVVIMYVNGDQVRITGNAFRNGGVIPGKFQIYCTDRTTSADISGNGEYTAVFYARKADVRFNGNGNASGSIISKTIDMTGNAYFHYDEDLNKIGPTTGYRARSWEELETTPDL